MHSICKFIFIVSLVFSVNQVYGNSVDAPGSVHVETNNDSDCDNPALGFDGVMLDDICLEDLNLVADELNKEMSLKQKIALGWKGAAIYSKMTKDQLIAHLSEHRRVYLLTLASLASISCLVLVAKSFLKKTELS